MFYNIYWYAIRNSGSRIRDPFPHEILIYFRDLQTKNVY
jgi:hypothetical protein